MKLFNKDQLSQALQHVLDVPEESGLLSALTIVIFAGIAVICWYLL